MNDCSYDTANSTQMDYLTQPDEASLAKHKESSPCEFPPVTCCSGMVIKEKLLGFIRNTGPLVSKCSFRPLLANIFLSLYRITLIFKVPPLWRQNSHFQAASLWAFHLLVQFAEDQKIQAFIRMTSTLRTVYHITAFSWYAFIVKSLADKDGEQLPPGIFVYGGPWKYLTFLNLVSILNIYQ